MTKKQQELNKFLEEHLKSERIQYSKSSYAALFFFVKKKNSLLWPVQFTKLNIQWRYNMRIREENEWKAAFRTNKRLFKLLVMHFELCNFPATFQLMIDSLLQELIDIEKVIVYMNDILIFTKTLEEHCNIVGQILTFLKKNKLILQSKKYLFY